jgi:coatomer protein complex subunit gamma
MNLKIHIHYQLQHLKVIIQFLSFIFNLKFIVECVKKIISYMGMQPCERSDKIPEGKGSHTLYLAGVYRGGHDVLVRAKMALGGTSADPGAQAIMMQLTIRSTDESAVQVIASAVE